MRRGRFSHGDFRVAARGPVLEQYYYRESKNGSPGIFSDILERWKSNPPGQRALRLAGSNL